MAKRILFQGDSITDWHRKREDFYGMGEGYPVLVKASLGMECPGEYEFINRGIGGNRSVDIYARIKEDFINLKPDYASIYMGVNDAWHEIVWNKGVDTEKFERVYSMLIDEVQAACPNVKLMIIAPFVLEGSATCNFEDIPDRWDRFRTDVPEKAAACKRVAQKYNLPLIELQSAFDEACKAAPADYWTYDGVHPTPCGHEIIKRLWLETFEKMK
ncbi:MAG: SGNH/GDSL hydrolase family protein [Oscillospiraceae bacterium]|nr:SGNH/GDSL hydrolase family protein [Oscillospiraceae bacterium]